MSQLQIQKVKTGDIILTSFQTNVPAMILRIFTFSDFHHAGIAVWVQAEKRVNIEDSQIEEKFFLDYAPDRELYVLQIVGSKTAKLKLLPYSNTREFSARVLHRAVMYEADDRMDKFKKFFKNYIDGPVGFGALEFLSCWAHPVSADKENIFDTESCVSFCLIWLTILGYSNKDKGVPYRARQLYSPDHLRVKYNRSSLLADKETIFKNTTRIMSPLVYFITIFCVLVLLVTTIVILSFSFKKSNILRFEN